MDAGWRSSLALAVCTGGFLLATGTAQDFPEFPKYPAASEADSSARHPVGVSVPTRLSVQRTADSLSISYDPESLREIRLTAGKKMTIGIKAEWRVYAKGSIRPVRPRSVEFDSVQECGICPVNSALGKSTTFLHSAVDGIPEEGKLYVIEEDISVFETDVPPQHMWFPESSRRFKVLWKKVLRTTA